VLRTRFFSAEQVEAIVRDYRQAGLEPAEVALMAFAEKVTLHAYEVTQEDIDALRAHGFSDADIVDIALTAASRSFFSKMTDALGFQPPTFWLKEMRELFGADGYKALTVGRAYDQADSAR
jgi:uncharacterized peroxidase-related enzyme